MFLSGVSGEVPGWVGVLRTLKYSGANNRDPFERSGVVVSDSSVKVLAHDTSALRVRASRSGRDGRYLLGVDFRTGPVDPEWSETRDSDPS